MTNITKFHSNFSDTFSEDPFEKVYEFIRNSKWIWFYVNGKKYIVFVWKGKILHLSEFQLALILSTLVFGGIVGTRKLCKRIKIRKKIFRLINKIRGGKIDSSVINLIDENDILHYEDKLPDILNYNPISTSHLNLSSKEKLVKSIVKKCLKPGHIYKITHRGVLEILDKMMNFKKSDHIKIISYDVLVLSLILALKPASIVTYQGTAEVLKKVISPFALEHLPLISALLTAVGLAFRVNINAGFSEVIIQLFFMLLKSTGAFRSAEFLRSNYFIDCTDYVKELPQSSLDLEINSSSSNSSRNLISYTREEPTRHDAFVSTSPNQQLHYQEDIKIETLDGEIRRVNKLKGKVIEYMENRQPATFRQPDYIPLDQRTRTLADVRSLDSTLDRESAGEITRSVMEEQIKASLVREALNGE